MDHWLARREWFFLRSRNLDLSHSSPITSHLNQLTGEEDYSGAEHAERSHADLFDPNYLQILLEGLALQTL